MTPRGTAANGLVVLDGPQNTPNHRAPELPWGGLTNSRNRATNAAVWA